MKVSSSLVTLAACLHHHFGCARGAPARTTDEVLLGEVDIAVGNEESNEVTEAPFEKKCNVEGKSYSHAQVVSYDANSRCICVAGNVYCFWHGLPPSTESPAQDLENVKEEESNSNPSTEPACRDSSLPTESIEESPPPHPSDSDEQFTDISKSNDDDKSDETEDEDEPMNNEDGDQDVGSEESTESIATTSRNDTPTVPVTCVVLDRTYRVGQVLPHNTGNCVECSCGPEGHVVCAPRDCVSIVPHRGYREESFQIPVAGDLRGIDENF